jgi:hypothetical protein
METRTRFDLSAAVEEWRKQLAGQPGLTADNRRELETHVQDSIATLQQRGLTEEESFWIACRRVGQPRRLAEEFVKEDPIAVWRDRLFWIAIGFGVIRLWLGFPSYLLDWLRSGIARLFALNFYLPDWVLFYVPLRTQWVTDFIIRNQIFGVLFRWAPLFCLIALLATGRLSRPAFLVRFLFESRARLLLAAGVSLALYYSWAVAQAIRILGHVTPGPGIPSMAFAIQLALGNAIISVLLVGLIAWLLPAERNRLMMHS